jgi:hypothetical protein
MRIQTCLFILLLTFGFVGEIFSKNEETPPTTLGEKVIRLPEFAITETMKLRPEEKWLTGQLGNFEVFSNASEKETRDFVGKLYKFHQVFTLLFPKVTSISRDKITLVLCGSLDKYMALAPLTANQVDERYGNLAYTTLSNGFNTLFLINFDVKSSFGDGVSVGSDGGNAELTQATGAEFIDGETLLRQQYIRLLLSRSHPRPPAWLEEGVARYFDSLKVNKTNITFAQLDMSLTRYFNEGKVNQHRMLFMSELFAITYDSPEYIKSTGSVFSHQALAFVHYAMFSHKGRYREPFFAFADRASKEPVTEPMFKSYFKMSFGDMEAALNDYVQGGFYRHVVVPKTSNIPPPPTLVLRETTDAESGRIKGDTLRLVKRYDDARIELVSPIMRKHADARLLSSLGILDYETQSFVAARKFLEEAVAAKTDNPAAYLTLAKLRSEEALSNNRDGKLNPEQLGSVLTPLYTALDFKQPNVEIYTLIADAWLHSQASPTFDNLVVLDQGVLAYPRNTDLIFKNATLKARYGFTDDARSLTELGVKVASDTAARSRFEQLKASLPPPTIKTP